MRNSWPKPAVSAAEAQRTKRLLQTLLSITHEYVSRLFAWLFIFQWIAVVLIAQILSPRTWSGTVSSVHIHVWSALIFGTLITSLPFYLTQTRPGAQSTRHIVAAGQMLMGALLIHVTGGRIESHFYVFGSLAFLALYKDSRVIVTATLVVVADHVLRGLFLPESVYGIASPQIWRTVEHGLWVVFEDVILLASCRQSLQTTRELAARQIEAEQLYANVETLVQDRTRELESSEEALRASECHYRNLFEDSPAGLYRTDPSDRVLVANPTLLKMLNYESIEEMHSAQFKITAPRLQSGLSSFRSEWTAKGGRLLLVEVASRAVRDEAGLLLGHEGTVEDITVRTLAERLESDSSQVLEMVGQSRQLPQILESIRALVDVQIPGGVSSIALGAKGAQCGSGRRKELLSSTGAPLGFLIVEATDGLSPQQEKALGQASRLAVIAIEHDQAYKKIAFQAFHDMLTGLPNRALFEKELANGLSVAAEQQEPLSVICINLNRFKQINDTLGHRVGDALLREVAERLRPLFGPGDTFARVGGDEFGIRLGAADLAEASAKAADVLRCFNHPFVTDRHELGITANLGISCYPESGQTPAELISHASIAMNQSKKLGSNRAVRFESGMLADLLQRTSLEKHIKTALANREFEIHYQPQVSLQRENGFAISGVEALLRWNSPVLGSVSPAQFIPVAEESGEIIAIGEWVLAEACKQSVSWTRAGLPPLLIAVNVSAVQFSRPGFIHSVETILAETGMDPRLLELELTETSVMLNLHHSNQQMKTLRDLGIKIAIDDFGSGYCSLNYLQKLPADTLKIDQLFVRGPSAETAGGRGILQAIVSMARSLNLHVVGEGVETEEQLFVLEQSGCNLAQGYLLSKPLPGAALQQLLVSSGTSAALAALARALSHRGAPAALAC